jgi:2-haloacid dehalogenase
MTGIVVFDAYGTILDVDAAARRLASEAGGERLVDGWAELSAAWRRKQLEYTWLRTLMGQYADFETLTADALDWALAAQGLADDVVLRRRLMSLYFELPAHADVRGVLDALDAAGTRAAILSNGTQQMLESALAAAGLAGRFVPILSVEAVRQYKPVPAVYDLVQAQTGTAPSEVLFVSANGWDAAGAAAFGFRTVWVNRTGLPVDRLPGEPAHVVADLSSIPELAA